jgi:alpha-beta hydrolase superfamily lysophospholipase
MPRCHGAVVRRCGGATVQPVTGKWIRRWGLRLFWGALLVLGTFVVGRGFEARRHLPLEPWHRLTPEAEVTAADLSDTFTLEQYLDRERELFAEVERSLAADVASRDPLVPNRYMPRSVSSPTRLAWDGNRTFERVPPVTQAGALLIHGLTDAPYSLHRLADRLAAQNVHALAIRMPGHGTVPAGLATAVWEDWMAAVRVGMRHLRARVGEGRPLFLVGYSNGGALAVKYALDTLDEPALPKPDRLLLISPMIGVSPAARIAWTMSLLGGIPYFEQTRWLDVLPEYLPVKYNSFPVNAAVQTHRLTTALDQQLASAATSGRIRELPPILTFQSLVDTTVLTSAVMGTLYARLTREGSELVLFDVNRQSRIQSFFRNTASANVPSGGGRYRLSVVSNTSTDSLDVVERTSGPGATTVEARPLGLAWPRSVFSLSHIALPFAPDDPVYGAVDVDGSPGLRVGALEPRGERQLLVVPVEQFMRLSYNPFYSYLESRAAAWLAPESRGN